MNTSRALMLLGVGVALFAISIVVLTQVLPGPHSERDYFIIGSLATLVSLFALFLFGPLAERARFCIGRTATVRERFLRSARTHRGSGRSS
jgi:hypothetical protein